MENTEKPEWLKKGAYQMYCSEEGQNIAFPVDPVKLLVLTIAWMLLVAYLTFSYGFLDTKNRSVMEGITRALGYVVLVSLPVWGIIINIKIFRKRRKETEIRVSNDPVWQDKFLQSEIERYEEYITDAPRKIEQIKQSPVKLIADVEDKVKEFQQKKKGCEALLSTST